MIQKRLLLVGANGFVGRNVLDALSMIPDADFVATVRSATAKLQSLYPSVRFENLDITDNDNIHSVMEAYQPTHVVNCAAYGVYPDCRDARVAIAVNAAGAIDLLGMAINRGVKRFIQIGTCSEYGPADGAITEDTALQPLGVYARTKAAGALMQQELARNSGTEFVLARLFGTWGPHEPSHRLLPTIVSANASGQPVRLTEGRQTRDFAYAPQVAGCLLEMCDIRLPEPVLTLNLGTGVPMTVRYFAEEAARALCSEANLHFGAIGMRQDEVTSVFADVGKLESLGLPIPAPVSQSLLRDYFSSRKAKQA